MGNLEEWFKRMEAMGQADIPMDFDGVIMTPREYMRRMRGG